jgi:hypothetical protein
MSIKKESAAVQELSGLPDIRLDETVDYRHWLILDPSKAQRRKPNAIMTIWIPMRGTQHCASGQHRNEYGMVF